MTGQPPDEALVASVARGEFSAFETLYSRHAPWVRAWAAHTLGPAHADDVLQEVFLRVWRAAPQFDPTRARFATWLAAITRHHVGRQLVRRGGEHRALAAATVLAALAAGPGGADEVAQRREDAAAVLTALRGLPEEQRTVIVLAYFAGLSQREIAGHLAIPLGTVKKRVRLGMHKLRDAIAPGTQPVRSLRIVRKQ